MHNNIHSFFGFKPELIHVGFWGIATRVYPYPGYCAIQVLQKSQKVQVSAGMGILQNLQKFRVRYGSVTELAEVPGNVTRAYRSHKISYKNDIPRYPRVFVALAYRTSRCSWYGYECRTELPEVPGTGMNVLQNLQKFFVG